MNKPDYERRIPLHIAAQERPFPPPVQLLLRLGAAVDWQDSHDITPLLLAISNRKSDPSLLILPLLEYHADVDLQDQHGLSPLFAAIAMYKSQDKMQYCQAITKRSSALHDTTRVRDQPYTPLLYAIQSRNLLAVCSLLLHGADVSASVDRSGFRYCPMLAAATCAQESAEPDILEALLQAKADPNSLTSNKTNPLHIYTTLGNEKCIKSLLRSEAEID